METWGDRIRTRRAQLGMSQAALAAACGVKAPSVSDWESGKTKTIEGPNLLAAALALRCSPDWILHGKKDDAPPLISEDIERMNARQIELLAGQALQMTRSEYDVGQMRAALLEHSQAAGKTTLVKRQASKWLKTGIAEVEIPLLDVRGSMGEGGGLLQHPPTVVEMVSANVHELRRRVSFSAPQNLRLITGYGDSMSPTFSDGDILLVDTGVTELKLDAVYTLQRDDELFIKRIQRLGDDRYLMISDNSLYRSVEIRPTEERYKVLARVVCVWNMRKL